MKNDRSNWDVDHEVTLEEAVEDAVQIQHAASEKALAELFDPRPDWVKKYRIIKRIEEEKSFASKFSSFTAWNDNFSARIGINKSTMFHIKQAGDYYNEWWTRHPDAPIIDNLIVDPLNLVSLQRLVKIGGFDHDQEDAYMQKLLKGEVKRSDLDREIRRIKTGEPQVSSNTSGLIIDAERALMSAVRSNEIEAVRALITAGANVNARGEWKKTLLMRVMGKDVQGRVVRALITAGADVNAADGVGGTAIMEAAQCGNLDVVKVLFESGALIDVKSSTDGGLLHAAAKSDNTELVKWLLERGLAVSDKGGYFEETPLIVASEYGSVAVIKTLLEAGAKIEESDKYGKTALLAAVKWSKDESVKALLKAGANVEATDNDGNGVEFYVSHIKKKRDQKRIRKALYEKSDS